jgi:hypothetical protein
MIVQAPVAITIVTNILTGIGSLSAKVPGTFAGFPPSDPANGRFFSHAKFCADTPNVGDYVDDLSVEDTDGVVPVPARALFPRYPTIINFSSDTGVATGSKAGYYLDALGCASIGVLVGGTQVIPSGLYLKATIHGALGSTYRVNIVWGKHQAP